MSYVPSTIVPWWWFNDEEVSVRSVLIAFLISLSIALVLTWLFL